MRRERERKRKKKWAREREIPKRILVVGIGHLIVNLVVTASGSNHDSTERKNDRERKEKERGIYQRKKREGKKMTEKVTREEERKIF